MSPRSAWLASARLRVLTSPSLCVHQTVPAVQLPALWFCQGVLAPWAAHACHGVSVQAFARAFYEDNKSVGAVDADTEKRGGGYDPRSFRPSSPDVVEVLTFSLIMLHTDAHNPSVKKEKKMTMAQFVSNNR